MKRKEIESSTNTGRNTSSFAKQRRLVLSEEDYSSTLSSIVQRDFFPDVSKLERQNALLDCRLRGDVAGAVAVRRASRRLVEHEEAMAAQRERDDRDVTLLKTTTLAANKTAVNPGEEVLAFSPTAVSRTIKPIRKLPRPLVEETLTDFHARATNEDDAEFDSNLKQEIRANRERLDDLFQYSSTSAKTRKIGWPNQSLSELASDDFDQESNSIEAGEWNRPKPRNGFFFNPTPLRKVDDGTSQTQPYDDKRRLMLPPSEFQTHNILGTKTSSPRMKNTEGIDESNPHTNLDKSQLIEYIPKHEVEKKIVPSQTRFSTLSLSSNSIQQRGILLSSADIMENSSDTENDNYPSTTDSSYYSTDLDASLHSVEVERERRNKRQSKQQQQRTYVAMTPQIIPGIGSQSPITTWGTVEGTPQVLSGRDLSDKPSSETSFTSAFYISAENEKERAARKAESELTRRSKRAKGAPTSSKRRIDSDLGAGSSTHPLTPAAFVFLDKTKRVPSRNRDAFGSALRMSYSAQRQSLSKSSVGNAGGTHLSKKRDHAYNVTPIQK